MILFIHLQYLIWNNVCVCVVFVCSTFVCPTEIIAFSDRIKEFEALNTAVVGVSVDSHFSHLAWINTPRKTGGLGDLQYPLLADITKQISVDYDVLIKEEGIALRGLYIIDKNGVIRQKVNNIWYDIL